jgi:predicted amidohydrolase YtcJ
MPRYLVTRTFPDGLAIPMTEAGAQACQGVVNTNAEEGVTWVHSYVTPDCKHTFCIYDAPDPDAIRRVAKSNHLPVDDIAEVRVLDPYFFR